MSDEPVNVRGVDAAERQQHEKWGLVIMVWMNNPVVLQAPLSFSPHSRHLTLNRADRIIGTRKAMCAHRNERSGRRTISHLTHGERSGTTYEVPVIGMEEQPQVIENKKSM